jgi:radical SAM/Cys-rich protein
VDGARPPARFAEAFGEHAPGPLARDTVTTLQINVGRRCNMACHHCHVDAGPKRTESLSRRAARRLIELLEASPTVRTVDLTGGAPELCPSFRELVIEARRLGRHVIDRCNLTILREPGQEDLAEFLARNEVEIVASLPCYEAANVDRQRGKGAFSGSSDALQRLNGLGYGVPGSRRRLDLVYNPTGPFLPPPQERLEARYKEELFERFGIEFHRLLTITNMPIRRFAHSLERDGALAAYMSLLVSHFNPSTLPGLMCRSLVSVGWDGAIYDCDFNQMLGLPADDAARAAPRTIWSIRALTDLSKERIRTGPHCFGCTAGAGSSCSGALSS